MRIAGVYNGLRDDKRGAYDVVVPQLQADNGQPYNRAIFTRNKALVEQFRRIPAGSRISILHEKKGDFWNVVGVDVEGGASGADTTQHAAPSTSERKPNIYTRDPEDTNHSAAVMAAKDIVIAMLSTGLLKKQPSRDIIMAELTYFTQACYTMIKGGAALVAPSASDASVTGSEIPADIAKETGDMPF